MSFINDNIKANTKRYLELQAEINILQQQINKLKDIKKQTETALIQQLQQNNLHKHAITYQGHKIYMKNETSYDNLTFKFLEICLYKLYNDKNKVKQIINYIKSLRNKRNYYCIKNT